MAKRIPSRSLYWVLGGPDGRTAIPATAREWAKWWDKAYRRGARKGGRIVKQTTVLDRWFVSTVFMGLDYAWKGPPIIFETMVFDGDEAGACERSSTWQEAEEAHERMCRFIKTNVAFGLTP